MDKGLIGFVLVFILLIGASVYMGNADQITPNVAQAQADLSIGAAPVQVLEKGAAWALKLLAGAAFTGIAVAAFGEFKKFYKNWTRNSQMKRWAPGPNANWQQQPTRNLGLTRNDLLLLALSGKVEADSLRPQNRLGKMREPVGDDSLDLEI
ncbi:MAG: hypothetical protein ABI904_23740 [Chloroflexota bacterium]